MNKAIIFMLVVIFLGISFQSYRIRKLEDENLSLKSNAKNSMDLALACIQNKKITIPKCTVYEQ